MIRDTSATDRPLPVRRPMWRWATFAAIAIAVVVTVVVALPSVLHAFSANASVSEARLSTAVVERGTFVRDIAAEGKVVAAVSPTLFASTAGAVTLQVHAGDSVKKGQVLAVIDSPDLSAKLAQERSNADAMQADVLSATNADLQTMVRAGTFRADLFYRLNVIEVSLPALAERSDDILPLATHFLDGKAALTDAACDMLLGYAWPGNVRELKNVITRAALLALDGEITPGLLNLKPSVASPAAPRNLDEPGRDAVAAALGQAHGVVSRAAQALGLSRQALYRRIERYDLPTQG